MSFDNHTTPSKKRKIHSPKDENHTWNHEEAEALLESHRAHKKINWSENARRLQIPGRNKGQVLKRNLQKMVLIMSHATPTRKR